MQMLTSTQSTQPLSDSYVDELNAATAKMSVCLYPMYEKVRRVNLEVDELRFGRLNLVQFVLPHVDPLRLPIAKSISKEQFIILRRRDAANLPERYVLKDCSSHKTFVNGQPVPLPKREVVLKSGDTIGIHRRVCLFVFLDDRDHLNAAFPPEITDHYVVASRLGAGASGEVFLVYERGSGTDHRFAMKCIPKQRFGVLTGERANHSSAEREVAILRRLSHPCIVQLEKCIETEEYFYILMEYVAAGELYDRLAELAEEQRRMREDVAKVFFYQLLLAVSHLHSHNITHRDLKPENVLLCSHEDKTQIKLTDFGLSKVLDAKTMLRTFCGTPQYLAPEVLATKGDGEYTQAIDCWSLGVILFMMLGGYPPFTSERRDRSLSEQILSASYSFPEAAWRGRSPEAVDLVRSLLTLDPLKRSSVSAALKHPWFDDSVLKQRVEALLDCVCVRSDGLSPSTFLPCKRLRV